MRVLIVAGLVVVGLTVQPAADPTVEQKLEALRERGSTMTPEYDTYPDPDENPLVIMSDLADWSEESCPACGELADYCLGHGEIGDPTGFKILQQHDNEDHTSCNPRGCEEANHG